MTTYNNTEMSVYDAMNLFVFERRNILVNALTPLANNKSLPLGSPTSRRTWGKKVELTHKYIKDFRKQALDYIIMTDPKLRKEAFRKDLDETKTSLGLIESR